MAIVGAHDLANALNKKELAELVLSQGAELNAKDKNGKGIILDAARQVNNNWEKNVAANELFKWLVEKGADLSVKNEYGESAMFRLSSNPELMQYAAKCDPALLSAPDNEGRTPAFTLLAKGRDKESFLKLAELGADLSAKTKVGTSLVKVDHDGWLDEAIKRQRALGISKALTTGEVLFHEAAKKPALVTTDAQLEAKNSSLQLPDTAKAILVKPTGKKDDFPAEFDFSKKTPQTVYIDTTNAESAIRLENVPKDSRVVLLINPDAAKGNKLQISEDGYSPRLQVKIGERIVADVTNDEWSKKRNTHDRIIIAVGSVKDNKVEITHQLSIPELAAKKEALLQAGKKDSPAKKEEKKIKCPMLHL